MKPMIEMYPKLKRREHIRECMERIRVPVLIISIICFFLSLAGFLLGAILHWKTLGVVCMFSLLIFGMLWLSCKDCNPRSTLDHGDYHGGHTPQYTFTF